MRVDVRGGDGAPMVAYVSSGDPLGPVDQDPDEVRDDACDIVAGGRACEPPPATTDPSSGGEIGAGFGQVLFIGAIIALVVTLVVLLARRWTPRRTAEGGGDEDDADADEPLAARLVDHANDPSSWRRRADEHRAAGRIRDAVRCRYRALVGDLARRGLLDEIPGRTSGEERAQLGELAPALRPAFDGAADLFDDAWFGDVPVSTSDDDRFQELERRVLDETARRRR